MLFSLYSNFKIICPISFPPSKYIWWEAQEEYVSILYLQRRWIWARRKTCWNQFDFNLISDMRGEVENCKVYLSQIDECIYLKWKIYLCYKVNLISSFSDMRGKRRSLSRRTRDSDFCIVPSFAVYWVTQVFLFS